MGFIKKERIVLEKEKQNTPLTLSSCGRFSKVNDGGKNDVGVGRFFVLSFNLIILVLRTPNQNPAVTMTPT